MLFYNAIKKIIKIFILSVINISQAAVTCSDRLSATKRVTSHFFFLFQTFLLPQNILREKIKPVMLITEQTNARTIPFISFTLVWLIIIK
jgi:hypothetical protein